MLSLPASFFGAFASRHAIAFAIIFIDIFGQPFSPHYCFQIIFASHIFAIIDYFHLFSDIIIFIFIDFSLRHALMPPLTGCHSQADSAITALSFSLAGRHFRCRPPSAAYLRQFSFLSMKFSLSWCHWHWLRWWYFITPLRRLLISFCYWDYWDWD